MVILLDGGFGSEMDRRLSLPVNNSPSWCAYYHEHYPSLVMKVHKDFIQAGSNNYCKYI